MVEALIAAQRVDEAEASITHDPSEVGSASSVANAVVHPTTLVHHRPQHRSHRGCKI